MNKKIIKVMSILQIVLCLVSYFSMSYHFDRDVIVFAKLANTDFVATMLRLSLYIVPGIHLLSGLYGLVFEDKKILIVMSLFELVSCGLSFTFVGKSVYMLILNIISCSIALIYFISVLTLDEKQNAI